MNVIANIFMIVSTIFSLATLVYVVVDLILEKNGKKEAEENMEEPAVIVIPEEKEIVHEVMPEIVDHIDAEEADAMISDELALQTANYEEGAGQGKQGIINIGVLDQHFEANDLITLAVLKERGLIKKNVGRLKILADGILNKPLLIKSESYSIQAIKMIELTGGTVTILKD